MFQSGQGRPSNNGQFGLLTAAMVAAQCATVRHRTKVTTAPGSRTDGLAMAFKVIEAYAALRVASGPMMDLGGF